MRDHRIAPQNGPLLGGTDNLGLLALHGDAPVDRGSLLIRYLSEKRRMLPVCANVKPDRHSDQPHAYTTTQNFYSV